MAVRCGLSYFAKECKLQLFLKQNEKRKTRQKCGGKKRIK
jgi:hypothetical protein